MMNRDVQLYIDSVADQRNPLFNRLHELIIDLYPNVQIVMSYQIPTYKEKTGWVALGYWKNGVSVYTDGPQHIAEFKSKHPQTKTGRGSINLKASDEVPIEDLEKVIKHSMEHQKQT